MVNEEKDGRYSATPYSVALATPGVGDMATYYFDVNGPAFLALPDFIKSIGYRNPTDHTNTAWKFHTGKEAFEWMKDNPEAAARFANVMAVSTQMRRPMHEVYPTGDLVSQSKADGVLLVDCGGSTGHDIEAFRTQHPQQPGRLVLQDRPEVIENATVHESIEKMSHDFFTPQPVKGAAAYYL